MSICCRPATTPARPARTSKPGWGSRKPASSARRGRRSSATTRCRPCTAGSAITPAKRAVIARSSTARSASTRSSVFSAISPRSEGWPMPAGAAPTGKRVLIVGAGPSGLSAAYHLTRLGHQVEIHEAGPLPGGMLHFGIPAYRLPRADLMKEIRRIEEMGVRIVARPQGRRRARRAAGRSLRRRLHRHRRPSLQARGHPGARRGQGARRGVDAARHRDRASLRCSAAASWSTAAATPRWTPRAPRAGSAPTTR